jgi:hypothetical protein
MLMYGLVDRSYYLLIYLTQSLFLFAFHFKEAKYNQLMKRTLITRFLSDFFAVLGLLKIFDLNIMTLR